MNKREITILSGVIAAIALAVQPASAGSLLGNNSVSVGAKVGGANANVGVNTGNDGVSANVGVNAGSNAGGVGVSATANAATSSATGATANVGVDTGTVLDGQDLAADVDVKLGDPETLRATIDLNGDGVINTKDHALVVLDINGDGVLGILDDANGDGILNGLDLGSNDASLVIGLTTGGQSIDLGSIGRGIDLASLPGGEISLGRIGIGVGAIEPDPTPTPDPGITPLPGDFDGGATSDRSALHGSLRNLDDADIASLKVRCADVMANPGAFDAATVQVCVALAAL